MQDTKIAEQLREVKQMLRGAMNGPVSQSMRQMGLTYKVNFGVELPRLRNMADEIPHDAQLAAMLWKEDIRECRLLAAMIMPHDSFSSKLAEVWIEQMRFTEEAECTVMHLFCHLPNASTKAFEWISKEQRMPRLCGWLLMARLFMQGMMPGKRDTDELLDQIDCELKSDDYALRTAAYKALLKYMELGKAEEARGSRLLR